MNRGKIKEWELWVWARNVENISIKDRARMVNWICDNWQIVQKLQPKKSKPKGEK